MAKARIDVSSLLRALDVEREKQGLSWRQLAKEIDVSPSMLSRMRNGYKPDADGFATLVTWLGMSGEQFMISEGRVSDQQPELLSELAPLLRARNDLEPEDVEYLEDVIEATLRRVRANREQ